VAQWFLDLVALRSWYLVPQVTQRLGDAGAQWLGDVVGGSVVGGCSWSVVGGFCASEVGLLVAH
jgi:hypothetical protein